jgi:hypothetical protein
MQSWNFYAVAALAALSGTFSGCCCVQRPAGSGSCCVAGKCGGGCPGILHGELAGRVHSALTGGCCSGCGEVYYDEHINEPPTCDPCCGNGEFTGGSCGPCRPLFERLRDLWCAPCATECSCDSCGGDMYAGEHVGGSGYCPNCRDGVAGNPMSHSHQYAGQTPTRAIPVKEVKSNDGMPASPPTAPNPSLEPVPDPVSDRPLSVKPIQARTTSSQARSSRTIQVPATQARHTASRVVNR